MSTQLVGLVPECDYGRQGGLKENLENKATKKDELMIVVNVEE